MAIPIRNPNRHNPTGIHIGDVTHHHDQSMTLHSFNTKKTMNRIPPIPIPVPAPEDVVTLLLMIL